MAQRIKIANGPTIIELEECVIGSQVTPIAVHLEEETFAGSGVYQDMDLTNKSYACDVRLDPKQDASPLASFAITPRSPLTGGWLDLELDGDITIDFMERIYQASLKVWPTGSPDDGDTLIVFYLPMKFRGTR